MPTLKDVSLVSLAAVFLLVMVFFHGTGLCAEDSPLDIGAMLPQSDATPEPVKPRASPSEGQAEGQPATPAATPVKKAASAESALSGRAYIFNQTSTGYELGLEKAGSNQLVPIAARSPLVQKSWFMQWASNNNAGGTRAYLYVPMKKGAPSDVLAYALLETSSWRSEVYSLKFNFSGQGLAGSMSEIITISPGNPLHPKARETIALMESVDLYSKALVIYFTPRKELVSYRVLPQRTFLSLLPK